MNYAATGKKIGAQAFGILSRIAAVDRLMTPELQSQVHEGHPEVSFAVAAGKHPRFNKKCPDGEQERLSILAQHDFRFDPEAERRRLGPSWLERDEIIDAGVMLWTAVRVQAGDARRLPNGLKERDHRGLLAEIWA